LEDQVRKGELLEARAREAERRLLELGHKLERVSINICPVPEQVACLLVLRCSQISDVIRIVFRLRRSISSRGRELRSSSVIFSSTQRLVHKEDCCKQPFLM
jgi:hypothetical protein